MYGVKKVACIRDSLHTATYWVLTPVWARFSVSLQQEAETHPAPCTMDIMSYSQE
jgi:uncharacterized membrane protein